MTKTRKLSPPLMKAFETLKLAEACPRRKTASACPSGLPTPLRAKGSEGPREIIGHLAEDDADAASALAIHFWTMLVLLTRLPRMGGVIEKRSHVGKLVDSPLLVYYESKKTRA